MVYNTVVSLELWAEYHKIELFKTTLNPAVMTGCEMWFMPEKDSVVFNKREKQFFEEGVWGSNWAGFRRIRNNPSPRTKGKTELYETPDSVADIKRFE
jgi:hypothetical protein